jgi:hypothetical protein
MMVGGNEGCHVLQPVVEGVREGVAGAIAVPLMGVFRRGAWCVKIATLWSVVVAGVTTPGAAGVVHISSQVDELIASGLCFQPAMVVKSARRENAFNLCSDNTGGAVWRNTDVQQRGVRGSGWLTHRIVVVVHQHGIFWVVVQRQAHRGATCNGSPKQRHVRKLNAPAPHFTCSIPLRRAHAYVPLKWNVLIWL